MSDFLHIIFILNFLFLASELKFSGETNSNNGDWVTAPSMLISILVRNKAHSLPYFLGYLERINYPKKRIGLLIRVDHCIDNSSTIMDLWLDYWRPQYYTVDYLEAQVNQGFADELDSGDWPEDRFWNMIRLRQEALTTARRMSVDYLFVVDADVLLLNPDTLQHLMRSNRTVVAPLLNCTTAPYFANFWGEMTPKGFYSRSSDYFDITYRHIVGEYPVAVVNTALLIHIKDAQSLELSYEPPSANYSGLVDEMILFALSGRSLNVTFFVNNLLFFGYFPQPPDSGLLENERELFLHLKLQATVDQDDAFVLNHSRQIPVFLPVKSKLGFDQIYVINLARRKDRRKKMDQCLDLLGIQVEHSTAIDGRELNTSYLKYRNIRQLGGYQDPYYKRSLKFGEIGCFLSHHDIWEKIVNKSYDRVLIFEDDVRFLPGFLRNLQKIQREANLYKPTWEMIYVGRKRLLANESFVPGSQTLLQAKYSHWTISYILNSRGAEKLMAQQPLQKMLALDEFLPIMFDQHPRKEWFDQFPERNLVALAAYPPLVKPIRFLGQPNYYSDTELSNVLNDKY